MLLFIVSLLFMIINAVDIYTNDCGRLDGWFGTGIVHGTFTGGMYCPGSDIVCWRVSGSCCIGSKVYPRNSISTSGHNNIFVEFYVYFDLTIPTNFEGCYVDISYNNGSSWNDAFYTVTPNIKYQATVDLPANADNNPNLKIRFRVDSEVDEKENCYINDLRIYSVTPPPTSQPTTTPTTSAPTTSAPTTSTPTTSNPTTSMPTTNVPTSVPTHVPTTNLPTTSVPTTSVPTTPIPTGTIKQTTTSQPTIETSIDLHEAAVDADGEPTATSNDVHAQNNDTDTDTQRKMTPLLLSIILVACFVLLASILICVYYWNVRLRAKSKANQTQLSAGAAMIGPGSDVTSPRSGGSVVKVDGDNKLISQSNIEMEQMDGNCNGANSTATGDTLQESENDSDNMYGGGDATAFGEDDHVTLGDETVGVV